MTAGNFAPFYSMPNAAGIILGTGNVGQYLRYEDANTYMSIDGGLTWIEAHKKPYIYEIGDHGGLLVMAPSTKKTKEVIFSWNEGTNWFEFEMAKSRIEVDNIVTAPNSVSTQFIVHGARGSSGVIYHMDFAALGRKSCSLPVTDFTHHNSHTQRPQPQLQVCPRAPILLVPALSLLTTTGGRRLTGGIASAFWGRRW